MERGRDGEDDGGQEDRSTRLQVGLDSIRTHSTGFKTSFSKVEDAHGEFQRVTSDCESSVDSPSRPIFASFTRTQNCFRKPSDAVSAARKQQASSEQYRKCNTAARRNVNRSGRAKPAPRMHNQQDKV